MLLFQHPSQPQQLVPPKERLDRLRRMLFFGRGEQQKGLRLLTRRAEIPTHNGLSARTKKRDYCSRHVGLYIKEGVRLNISKTQIFAFLPHFAFLLVDALCQKTVFSTK